MAVTGWKEGQYHVSDKEPFVLEESHPRSKVLEQFQAGVPSLTLVNAIVFSSTAGAKRMRIEQRLEDRVPELEQLERVGLFTRKEIRAVLRKASALEYKIQRRALRKEDFINYIQYEVNLLELIKKRRARIGYPFKKDEIEHSILHRVHSLFNRATGKWKDDVQLWLSHVAFCKQWNAKHQLSKVFSTMLAIHSNKPALWIMAAKWEMETRLSSESARHLFLRALRFHPDCPKLYQEYFRMELMHAEKQRKEKKEFEQAKMDLGEFNYSEEILNGEMARIVYRDASQKIKGVEFQLAVLSIAKLFDFTQDLQKEILENLQTRYADDPLTWDYMARRELELGSLQPTEHTTKQKKVSEMAQREERCCAVFDEAVRAVPTEDMWKCYITFCLERYDRKTNSEELKQKRLERTLNVFSKAHESSLLLEALYKHWLQLLLDSNLSEKAVEVAEAATSHFSQSVEMWQMRLQVLIQLKRDDVTQCFEEAIKHVKSKGTLPLWTLWVEWSEGKKSKEDTEALYERSLHATTPAESVTMKEMYLDWTYRNGGYKKVKRLFTSLCENHPFSLDFFRKMIQIEKEQESCKMLHLREYYERALREFGSTNTDLWLDYIKEELSHPKGKPQNCGSIHWRAMKMLQGDLVEDFVSKYTLLQTGHL
ncbi:PREDICTED: U3 small nucleolar RNA-associated protein 6 homolog [Corvus brachyrhynchos]|nr:PREDICTED: U3 small nucleolar RNA-associated protein 6 homolog [Corvus brachyrhynchos]